MNPTPAESDDADLVRRVALRDAEAFGLLYDRHSTLLYSVALRILADPEEARDVLQQVFLTLHLKAHRYDSALGRPVAWLSIMTRNRSLDRIRSLKRQRECVERIFSDAEALQSDGAPATEMEHDEIASLRAAVEQLPDDQRRALQLAYFSGLTQQEIADTLAQPLGTVKARIRRGLIKLRESLQGILN